VYRGLNKFGLSLDHHTRAIAGGRHPAAFNNRALTLKAMGRFAQALEDLSQAIAISDIPLYHLNKAEVHADMQDSAGVVREASLALRATTKEADISKCKDLIKEWKSSTTEPAGGLSVCRRGFLWLTRSVARCCFTEAEAAAKRKADDGSDGSDEGPAAKRPRVEGKSEAVEQWSTAAVCEWVRGVGGLVAPCAALFEANSITGASLLLLDTEALTELGVASHLHRTQLIAAIAVLRKSMGMSSAFGSKALADADGDADMKAGGSGSAAKDKPVKATAPAGAAAAKAVERVICTETSKAVLHEPCGHAQPNWLC
jgi:hypothetical protein